MQVYIIGSLSFVVNLILNIVYDSKLKAAAEKINSKSIDKIIFTKKKQIFKTTKWGELEVGDIIKVQKSQELPADVLILDISGQSNEQEIHVIGGNLSDIQVPELKRSHQGTSNKTNSRITIRKIVEQISGILKWECQNSGHFSGTLKLNDNPSAFEIKAENIILRGSSIYYTQDSQTQVTCLVLNVGDQCIKSPFRQQRELNAETKMNLNKLKLRKRVSISNQINLLCIIQLLIIVILSTFISITEKYVLNSTDMIKFVPNMVSQLSVFKKIIVIARLLLSCYPYMMHVTFELCALAHILFILWDINLVPCQVVFNNFDSVCKLGNINNIVMSRSCMFNKQLNQKIVSLQFSNSFFMNQDNGNDKIQYSPLDFDNDMHKSFSFDENENNQTRDQMDYLPNELKKLQTFRNLDLQVMITTNTNPELQSFFELLKAATICHRASNKGSFHNESKKLYKSFQRSEIAQLMFANSFGYHFNQRKNKVITINDSLQQLRFQELLYYQIDRFDTILTFQIIKPIGGTNQNCQMILKGELHEMKRFLVSDLDLDAEVSKYLQKGIATMAFATKFLDFEEAQALSKQVQEWANANSDKNDRIAEELLMYAQDSFLIGILGINKECNLRNSLVLEEAYRNGIKVWMITDDSEFRSLTDYNQLKFLQNCSQPLNIKGSNEREVEESIKNGLRIILDKKTQMNQTLNTTSNQATKKSLSTPDSHQETSPSTMSRQKRNLKKSQEDQEPKHVLFFNGNSLKYILKDETLKKSFLLLCSMCNFMIGSKTNANQKANLVREISIYNKISDIGEVLGIVSSTYDQFIIDYADITVGLNYKYQKSDCMAAVDIQLQDFYGVSYLLFKHGTFYVRRLTEIQTLYNHRTLLINMITIYLIVQNCLSALPQFLNLFFTVFMVVITPAVYLIIGSTHKSFGFDYFYRIFGEYKYNFLSQGVFTSYHFIAHALIDFVIFISIYIICWASVSENPRELAGQDYIDLETMQVYNVFMIVIIFCIRLFNREIINVNASILCGFFLFISLVFTLESSSYPSLGFIFQSPQLLMHLLFVVLLTFLSNFGFYVARTHLLINYKEQMKFYQDIEEKVFFEEYEDPTTEFRILESDCRKKKFETVFNQKNIIGINKNMMKLHRSDSMDQILDKINSQGDNNEQQVGKKFNNSYNVINKITLKLNDVNKELEYMTQVQNKKIGMRSVKNIYVLLLLFVFLLLEGVIFKLIGLRKKEKTDLIDTSYTQKTLFSGNVSIIYVQVCHIVLALIVIYLITRTKNLRLDLIILGYIFLINILMCVQFLVDPSNNLNEFTYFFILAFSFISRQHYVYSVALFTITTTIIYVDVHFNLNIKNMKLLQETAFDQFQNGIKAYQLDVYFQIVYMLYIVLIWFIYAYQDEQAKKIQFVTSFRKSKEFNKLLQIMNILLPLLVRQRIQDGQKNFSDSQGEVTIIFIEVDQFDAIVSTYSGKELIDLLESLYNAFDQLCEQYGLSKVETVGKTYMACAGLKFFETSIDQRLLGNHQSVRVTDFAVEALAVVEKKIMKDGTKAAVKIGIHSGEVISGVVGETKPQFSLIGETVNKTSRVCSKCPSHKILVSKETHQHLCQFSNNFKFKMMEVEMKGIGTESVYTVERKNIGFLKRNQKGSQAKQGFNKNTPKTAALKAMMNEQENQNNDNGVETYRSMQPSEHFSEQASQTQNSMQVSDGENKQNEASEDEDDVLMLQQLNFAQFKDDRLICKNPSLNMLYNCVERPRFLMQFQLKEKENEFYCTLLRDNKSFNALFLFLKCVFDSILSIGLAIKLIHLDMMWVCIFWIMFHFCIQFTVNYYTEKSKTAESNGLIMLNYAVSSLVELTLTIIPNFLFPQNSSVRESTKIQIMVVMMMVFVFKGFPIRYGLLKNVILSVIWLILEIFFGVWKQVDIMTLITNQVIFVICLLLLGLMSFNREMTMRKQYNQDRIVEVEIKKTDELLSKLVPVHVLRGLKNDERIVEQVENVTLLYTDMVGFTAFSKSVKQPQEVVQLLSQLFCKFDQLVEAKGVYKVHTIGDCYVVMGYTGKVSKYRRNENIQIEEAYRVVQVGFEMIEIIKSIRENAKNPNLKNLGMRIGIHSGKITGGIIGTKVVRYDIFGNDVLIANKMESNGVDSQVVISESTLNLLNKNQSIMDSMEFTHHKHVDIPALNKTVNSFIVKQIIQVESEYSYSSDGESEDEGKNSKEGTTKSSKRHPLEQGISNSSRVDEDDDEEGHDSDQSQN